MSNKRTHFAMRPSPSSSESPQSSPTLRESNEQDKQVGRANAQHVNTPAQRCLSSPRAPQPSAVCPHRVRTIAATALAPSGSPAQPHPHLYGNHREPRGMHMPCTHPPTQTHTYSAEIQSHMHTFYTSTQARFRANGGELSSPFRTVEGNSVLVPNKIADPRLIFIRDGTSRIPQCSVRSVCLHPGYADHACACLLHLLAHACAHMCTWIR